MRLRLPAVVAVACATTASAAVAATAASPPVAPPPKVSGAGSAPPPAWLERSGAPSRWLAYGSFCWRTACVDFLPPQLRPDLPRVRVRVGSTVRFHLGFRPSALALEHLGRRQTWKLPAARVSAWRVRAPGVVVLTAKGPGGSAGYVVRLG